MVDVIYFGVGDKCKLVVVKNSLVFVMSSKIVFFHNGSFFFILMFLRLNIHFHMCSFETNGIFEMFFLMLYVII